MSGSLGELDSALGLAFVAVAAATAGFLAASVPSGGGGAAGEVLAPGEAHSPDASTDLLHVTAEGPGPATLFVFDGNGTFQAAERLSPGDGLRTVDLEVPDPILLVPETSSPLRARSASAGGLELAEVPTRETARTLASARGGTVDEDVSVHLPARPASLSLRVDGTARDVDATVRTSEGPALRQINTTWPVNATRGQARLHPANLTNGTYRVSVHADRVTGSLELVARTFEGAREREPIELPNASIDRLGAPVARVEEGQAWRVDTQDAGELRLAIRQGASARLFVYDHEHRLVRRTDVGQRGPSWEWGSNASEGPSYQSLRLGVPDGRYVLYVDDVQGTEEPPVFALLPGRDEARPGLRLAVEDRIVDVPYASQPGARNERQVRVPGGLVDVGVEGGDGAGVDRRVVVDSPVGIVLEHRDQGVGDANVGGGGTRYVERFGPGPFEIGVETDAAAGSTHVRLEHYVP